MKSAITAVLSLVLGVVLTTMVLILCHAFGAVGHLFSILIAYALVVQPAIKLTTSRPVRLFVCTLSALIIPVAANITVAGPAEFFSPDFRPLFIIYPLVGAIAAIIQSQREGQVLRFKPAQAIVRFLEKIRARWQFQQKSDEAPDNVELAPNDTTGIPLGKLQTISRAPMKSPPVRGTRDSITLGVLTGLFTVLAIITGAFALFIFPQTSKGTGFAWIPLIIFASGFAIFLLLAIICAVARQAQMRSLARER